MLLRLLSSIAFLSVSLPAADMLLVLSKGDRTLAVVDPATRQVVARMPSGPDPHEVVVSSDGKWAFVSNYGGGAYNTLTVEDLTGHKTLETVDLGALRGPHGLDFKYGKAWFTAEAAKAIGSYDPGTRKIDWIMGTGQDRTHMILLKDENTIITSNIGSATLTLLERFEHQTPRGKVTDWKELVVPVGRGAEGFDLSPDGKEVWAANAQDGTVSVIDLAAKKVVATLDVNVNGANRLKFTPDGKLVFVSLISSPDLVILDAAKRTVVKRLKLGRGAEGIQMSPGGKVAYVACTPDNYVAEIDLHSLEVVGKIDAGPNPDGMAWLPGR